MERKIRSELIKMIVIMTILLSIGAYAHDFVIAGIKAKAALNLSIFALFGVAAGLAFRNVLGLRNEVTALHALQTDFDSGRRRDDERIYTQPAIIFREPVLLGQGYRLITEQLSKQDDFQMPSGVVESLVHSVDQRIGDRKSVVAYFAGLMVFMGLIGAFMGLMHTVGSVGDLIGGMDMSGKGGDDAIAKMIEGMKAPLRGMSVGFSSSLFGLSTSMVLGALERCMTTAAKALRDEYEHWLSNLAKLETTEAAEGDAGGMARVTQAIEMAGRQLSTLHTTVEDNRRREAATQGSLTELGQAMVALTRTVERVSDPAPLVEPIARTVTDVVRQQARLVAEMELLFEQAREDRAVIRTTLDAIARATAAQADAARSGAVVERLDRLIAAQEAAAQQDPVVIEWGGGGPVDAPRGARSLQERLRQVFTARRDDVATSRTQRRMAQRLEALIERQRQLEQDLRSEALQLRRGAEADSAAAAELRRALESERERLAVLAELVGQDDVPVDIDAALERARLQMELLAIKSGRLRDARAPMTQKTAKG
ncbi:hypothetical protein [uncultured Sphingomonas sp.]|jgi:hypothetical protein|uniref:hypothetical protein n=1 Tax=uncultured Sphingomonas sp. TaxID=158754 RepID=UPI0030DD6984